jgi:hypothetical protein
MITGFWWQRSPGEKWFEEIGVALFIRISWAALWGRLSLKQLSQIDKVVKNLKDPPGSVREKAREWKRATPAVATSRIIVNPKIDSKNQRRIQCSLPFDEFWRQVGREPAKQDQPALFGFAFPNPVQSASRTFNPA